MGEILRSLRLYTTSHASTYYHVDELLAMLGNEALGPMAIDEYVSAKGVNLSAVFDYVAAKRSIRYHGPTTTQILTWFRILYPDCITMGVKVRTQLFLEFVTWNNMAQLARAPYEPETIWVCPCPRCLGCL